MFDESFITNQHCIGMAASWDRWGYWPETIPVSYIAVYSNSGQAQF